MSCEYCYEFDCMGDCPHGRDVSRLRIQLQASEKERMRLNELVKASDTLAKAAAEHCDLCASNNWRALNVAVVAYEKARGRK